MRFDHVGVLVGDLDGACAFARDALGLGEPVAEFRADEYGEEEWVLVLRGRPSVRTPEGVVQLDPYEVMFFPRGPEGAHQIRNDTEAPVRVLMWSSVRYPTATAYPDSDKVGVWTGDKAEDGLFVRSSAVEYFHGEAG